MIESVGLQTRIPARMESVLFQGRKLILDGAHNGQKMQALVAALLEEYGTNNLEVIIAVGKNKISSIDEIFEQLSRIVSGVYLTTFGYEAGDYKESMNLGSMSQSANKAGLKVLDTSMDPLLLLKKLVLSEKNHNPILLTGSYYLFNSIRPNLF